MPGDFKPRNWTRRARRRGGLLALAAAVVIFSYSWVNWSWIGLILIDALGIVGADSGLDAIWVVIGLTTLVALPVFILDQAAGWWSRKERGDR